MKHYYKYTIPYQDVDSHRRLRLFTLENYLLVVAGRAADDSGFGIEYLYPQGLTWIITRLQARLTYIPTHGDTLLFETWVEHNAHMLSTRAFRIYLMPGRTLIGEAQSIWAILDLQKREIVNIFDQKPFQNCVEDDNVIMPHHERCMPAKAATLIQTHIIQYSDVDYNNHCNSCKYLEIMLNAHYPKFLSLFSTQTEHYQLFLSINYAKEIALHQTLSTFIWVEDDKVQYQQKDNDGNTNCYAKIAILKK